MGLSLTITTPQKTRDMGFSARMETAVAAAKSAAKRQISAVPEAALNRVYRRSAPASVSLPAETTVKLAVDEATGTVVGKVADRETGEIVAHIPSEEILRLIAQTKEMLKPLVNETV